MPLNPVAIYDSNLGSTGNSLGKRGSHVFLGGEEVGGDGDFVPKKGRVTITGKLDYDSTTAAGGTFTQNTLVPKSYVDANAGGSSVTVVNDAGAPSTSDASVYSCLAATNQFAPTSHTHTIANVSGLQGELNGKAPLSHTHTIAEVNSLQTSLDAKLGLTNIKNFDSALTAYNSNGDFTTNTVAVATSGTHANTAKFFSGPATGPYTAITDWSISRYGSSYQRWQVHYGEHNTVPQFAQVGSNSFAIQTPTSKPYLMIHGGSAQTSFSTLTNGEQYTLQFYASHLYYTPSTAGTDSNNLVVTVQQIGASDQTVFDGIPTKITGTTGTSQYFSQYSPTFSSNGATATVLFSYTSGGGSNNDDRVMFISDVQVQSASSSGPPQASDGHGIFGITNTDKLNVMRIKAGNSMSIPAPDHGVMTVDLSPTPTADTPTSGDNTTRLATTAFVNTALNPKLSVSNIKNFDSAGTAYNTNSNFSSHPGLTIDGQGKKEVQHGSTTSIPGFVVWRTTHMDYRYGVLIQNGGRVHNWSSSMTVSNPAGTNMIGLKGVYMDVAVAGLSAGTTYTLSFLAACYGGNAGTPTPTLEFEWYDSGNTNAVAITGPPPKPSYRWYKASQQMHSQRTHTPSLQTQPLGK